MPAAPEQEISALSPAKVAGLINASAFSGITTTQVERCLREADVLPLSGKTRLYDPVNAWLVITWMEAHYQNRTKRWRMKLIEYRGYVDTIALESTTSELRHRATIYFLMTSPFLGVDVINAAAERQNPSQLMSCSHDGSQTLYRLLDLNQSQVMSTIAGQAVDSADLPPFITPSFNPENRWDSFVDLLTGLGVTSPEKVEQARSKGPALASRYEGW